MRWGGKKKKNTNKQKTGVLPIRSSRSDGGGVITEERGVRQEKRGVTSAGALTRKKQRKKP